MYIPAAKSVQLAVDDFVVLLWCRYKVVFALRLV